MTDIKNIKSKKEFTRSTIDSTLDKVYDYIIDFMGINGYPPSVRDICKGTGLKSTSTVHSHIKRLQDSGKLDYASGRRRAISITEAYKPARDAAWGEDHSANVTHLPLIGTVTAGSPILAQQNIERTLPFPSGFFDKKGDVFALRVSGDSMMDAAILDGDYVIVRKQNTANFGDYIVAMIEDEATVKTFAKIDGKTYLQPENPRYDPIPFYSENCQILGKVVGVFRGSV